MQNPIKKLDKVLLFSRNQAFCLKIWKFWQGSTTRQFLAEILHTLSTY